MLIAVLAAVSAGCAFAVSSVLQQRAARSAPEVESLSVRLLWHLLHRRDWLIGAGSAFLSFALQALALAFGPVALVQPLMVCELLFAIPLSVRLHRRRMGRREWTGTGLVAAGLVAFLWAAAPGAGRPDPGLARWGLVAAVVLPVVGLAVALGRLRRGPLRASLFALAAGCTFGLQAALTKSTTWLFASGVTHALTSWQPYAIGVVGPVGVLLGQSAYQAGPLAASLPVLDAAEPATAIMIGAFAFGEPFATTPAHLVGQLLGVFALLAGIVLLDSSPLILDLQRSTGRRRERSVRAAQGGARQTRTSSRERAEASTGSG